jgi:uncharacterized membrane protein required for colicin V production
MHWLDSITTFASGLSIGWVDFLLIIVICVGIIRGRKRGLSEELLDTAMWITILLTGGFFYHALGDALNAKPILSKLSYYMMSYMVIALVVKIAFVLIKRKFGAKLVESDMFGRAEFYGGMAAGAVRFGCMFFFLLSLLHAPYYSPEFLAKRAKEVDYNYGSDFFPHPCKIQAAVFKNSFTGKTSEKYLAMLLIEQTEGKSQSIRDENSMGKRRERELDILMGRR